MYYLFSYVKNFLIIDFKLGIRFKYTENLEIVAWKLQNSDRLRSVVRDKYTPAHTLVNTMENMQIWLKQGKSLLVLVEIQDGVLRVVALGVGADCRREQCCCVSERRTSLNYSCKEKARYCLQFCCNTKLHEWTNFYNTWDNRCREKGRS